MEVTVWQVWHNAATEYIGRRVVGLIPGYGVFDWRGNELYRVFEESRSVRRATRDEQRELDWAAAHGCLQIEVRSAHSAISPQPVTIVWKATGR